MGDKDNLADMSEKFERLRGFFSLDDLEWRVQRETRDGLSVLCYIDARAARRRLNEVFGAENWKVRYAEMGKGVLATISIRCGDEWVDKSDGSDYTDFEAFKGGISGAFKRAAAVWGIGEYLYDLTTNSAEIRQQQGRPPEGHGWRSHKRKDNSWVTWRPPLLPVEMRIESEKDLRYPPDESQGSQRSAQDSQQSRPQALPSRPSDGYGNEGDHWSSFSIHFGKNRGTKIGDLGVMQVKWYHQTWEPTEGGQNTALKNAIVSMIEDDTWPHHHEYWSQHMQQPAGEIKDEEIPF